jgi:O-antigen ligase
MVSVSVRTGRVAFVSLVVFVFLVYANPSWLLFDGADVGIAKVGAAFALLALGCSWLLYQRRLLAGGAVGACVAAFFLWICGSLLWSIEPSATRAAAAEALKYFAIFFLVANVVDDAARARQALAGLALASAIPAAGALWSYAHGEHLVEGTRASWIGTFGDPNDLAYYLAAGVAAALGARELSATRRARVAYTIAIGIMLVAILFTQSRGGLITTGVVFALFALRALRRLRFAIPVATVVIAAVWLAPRATWERAGTTLAYQEDASARGRIDAWNTGRAMFAARPFHGVGLGAFQYGWDEWAPGDAGPARAPHNTYVQVLAETGLVGTVLFFGAIALGLARAFRVARAGAAELRPVAWAAVGGLAAFAVASLTLGELFSWPVYILLGLAVAVDRMHRAAAVSAPSPATAFVGRRLAHGR